MWSVAKRIPDNLIFFVAAFLCLWFVVEPRLIYLGFGTIFGACDFATGWSFFRDSLARPGGFIAYVSGGLSQGFCVSWLGALIIVLVGLILSALTRRHLIRAGGKGSTILSAVPAIAVFALYGSYEHPLTSALVVSSGLLFSLILERLPSGKALVRSVACVPLAVLAFWLAGAGGLLVFALMTVAHRAPVRKEAWLAVLVLPVAASIVWALARYVFLLSPRRAFSVLTPFDTSVTAGLEPLARALIFVLYGFVPLTVLVISLAGRLLASGGRVPRAGKAPAKRLSLLILRRSAAIAAPIMLLAVLFGISRDAMDKVFVLSNARSRERRWDKILELGRSLPKGTSNVYVNHDILRALYHTGRLPYDMFQFPQMPQALLLTHESRESDLTQMRLCDIFFEMGHVNMAERLASELLAVQGRLPVVLERLSWINIIKGQNDAAVTYLNALKEDLVYHDVATSLLDGLENGLSPERMIYVERMRSSMPEKGDAFTGAESVDELLTALLERNPRNRMAFEYLMACYLLTRQVDEVVAHMGYLNELGYSTIPTLYEEAILIHYGLQGQKLDVSKFNIRAETIRRYVRFVQVRNSMQTQDRTAVLNHLIREFGTSYFFYFTLGKVGLS